MSFSAIRGKFCSMVDSGRPSPGRCGGNSAESFQRSWSVRMARAAVVRSSSMRANSSSERISGRSLLIEEYPESAFELENNPDQIKFQVLERILKSARAGHASLGGRKRAL